MKRSVRAALLCGVGASLVLACSAGGEQSGGQSAADGAHPPAAVADGEAREAQALARTVLDEKIASSGEAFAKEVPPELAAKLEAQYQASLKQRAAADLLAAEPRTEAPANFDVLFERIRNASPGTRNAMVAEYVEAVQQVQDPAERMPLFKRLEAVNIAVY